jgi:hypothetical protein
MEDNRVFKKMKIAIIEDMGFVVTKIIYYKWTSNQIDYMFVR